MSTCVFCEDNDSAIYSVCLKCLQTSPNWHRLEFHQSLTDNEPFSGGCDYCNHPCREVVYDVNLCDEHVGINDVDEHPEYEHIQTYIDLVKLRMSCPDISKSYKLDELCHMMDLDTDEYDINEMHKVFDQSGFKYDTKTKLYAFPIGGIFWNFDLPEDIKHISVEFYSKEHFDEKTIMMESCITSKLFEKICHKSDKTYVVDFAIMKDTLKIYIGSE